MTAIERATEQFQQFVASGASSDEAAKKLWSWGYSDDEIAAATGQAARMIKTAAERYEELVAEGYSPAATAEKMMAEGYNTQETAMASFGLDEPQQDNQEELTLTEPGLEWLEPNER